MELQCIHVHKQHVASLLILTSLATYNNVYKWSATELSGFARCLLSDVTRLRTETEKCVTSQAGVLNFYDKHES